MYLTVIFTNPHKSPTKCMLLCPFLAGGKYVRKRIQYLPQITWVATGNREIRLQFSLTLNQNLTSILNIPNGYFV